MPFAFPLALEITGRRCVVIGGGATATAKVGAADLPGPALLVVGDVVRLSKRIAWFGVDRATAPPVR